MSELSQSYDHLRMAAAHAAGGAAEKVTPGYDRARNAAARGWSTTKGAFSPLYEQMREGAANARRENVVSKRNRWPVLVGLLAAGAAAGAAGAMVARRRRAASEWDEYEPLGGAEGGYPMAEEPRAASATKKMAEGAASVASSVSSGAGKVAESLHNRSNKASGEGGPPASGSPS